MKKVFTFFVFVFILSARIWALDAYGTYQFTSLSLAATLDPSFVGYGSFSDFAYLPLIPSGNSGGMGFRDWNDAALNENKYLSFTVTLTAPNNFNGISLKLNLPNRRVSSEGPPNGEVRYRFGSTGNFLSFTGNTWTPPISTTLTDYEFDLPINNSNQYVLEIRIYGWNGTTVGGATGRQWVFDNVKLSGSSLPLPIELTSFTASVTNKHVTLNWQTATETDNYGFNIERASTSLNQGWEKIGFVTGSGNSNASKNYSFTDKTATTGKYSYRLKQIDAIGNYSYSNEVEVDLGIPTAFALDQNYPNPFNPSTIISYQLPMQSDVQVNVFNSIGEKVAVLVNEVKEAGYYEVEFNAASLSSGIYFYSIKAGDFVNVKKMMMVK